MSSPTSILFIVKFQVQQVQALRTMTATTAITVKEPRLQKTVKESLKPTAKNKQRGRNDRRTKQSKQPTIASQCSDVNAELEQKH